MKRLEGSGRNEKKEHHTARFRRNSPRTDAAQAPHDRSPPSPPHRVNATTVPGTVLSPGPVTGHQSTEVLPTCTHQLPWGTGGCSHHPCPTARTATTTSLTCPVSHPLNQFSFQMHVCLWGARHLEDVHSRMLVCLSWRY